METVAISISIPEHLLPGVVARASLEGVTVKDIVQERTIELLRQTCKSLKIGPYYRDVALPVYDQDGNIIQSARLFDFVERDD
jgi:hypothetical protein